MDLNDKNWGYNTATITNQNDLEIAVTDMAVHFPGTAGIDLLQGNLSHSDLALAIHSGLHQCTK